MSDELFKSKKFIGVYYKILENKDKSFYITFKDSNNKTIKRKVGRQSEGVNEAFCNQTRLALLRESKQGKNIELKKKISILELLEKYILERNLVLKTQQEYRQSLNFFIKISKKTFLEDIKREDINKFKNYLVEQGKANQTVNSYIEILRALFNYAIRLNIYNKNNPCTSIDILKVNNNRIRFLSKEEIEILKEKLEGKFELLLFTELSLSTGARLNSVLSITKKDINLENKTINIQNFKSKNDYLGFISPSLFKILEDFLQNLEKNELLIKLNKRQIQGRLKPILDKLFNKDLDLKDAKNRVVIHTFRHTFASHLAINGVPIFTIMKLLDHKDIKDTMRYSKLSKENGLNAVLELWK